MQDQDATISALRSDLHRQCGHGGNGQRGGDQFLRQQTQNDEPPQQRGGKQIPRISEQNIKPPPSITSGPMDTAAITALENAPPQPKTTSKSQQNEAPAVGVL